MSKKKKSRCLGDWSQFKMTSIARPATEEEAKEISKDLGWID